MFATPLVTLLLSWALLGWALDASFSSTVGEVTVRENQASKDPSNIFLLFITFFILFIVSSAGWHEAAFLLNNVFKRAGSGQSVHSGAVEYLQCGGLDALPSISHVSA